MNPLLDECIEMFASLPGVGRKTAARYVIHLLRNNKKELNRFHQLMSQAIEKIEICPRCHAIITPSECPYCSNPARKARAQVCVVQDFRDLLSIENTGRFHGTYHILGGLISPIDGIGPSDLNLASLDRRVGNNEFEEMIFALGTTREADTTQYYLFRKYTGQIKKFTTLPKGISHGTDLEYADEVTLGGAIENRVPVV